MKREWRNGFRASHGDGGVRVVKSGEKSGTGVQKDDHVLSIGVCLDEEVEESELMKMDVKVDNCSNAVAPVDCGASGSFIDLNYCKENGIKIHKAQKERSVKLADGSTAHSDGLVNVHLAYISTVRDNGYVMQERLTMRVPQSTWVQHD